MKGKKDMKKVEIERILFYYLCGEEMAEKMSQDKQITYEEFDKITYILIELRFCDLLVELWGTFYNQFQEDIDKSNSGEVFENLDDEIEKCEKWLYEFSDNAPTEELKAILREIFDIPQK